MALLFAYGQSSHGVATPIQGTPRADLSIRKSNAKWGAAAPPLFSLPPPSFETVTHFATGKHLSDALLPPPPSPSPERKNGNTLIQSGVTKRPFLEAENRAIKASPPILAALKDCRKLPDNPSSEMYGNKYILQEISMPRRTT